MTTAASPTPRRLKSRRDAMRAALNTLDLSFVTAAPERIERGGQMLAQALAAAL